MSREYNHTLKNDRGFTLLEVLIALLVLSIGLLGLAALQTTGLRSNQMASMRTQATQVAYDITDRMRANPAGITNLEYDITLTQQPVDTSATGTALADLTAWRDAVENLPGGQSQIVRTVDAAGLVIHTITVHWNETRDPSVLSTNTTCPPAAATDLRCYRLVFSE